MDQQTSPQSSRPGSAQPLAGDSATLQPAWLPELSPPHHKPLDSHKHQLPTQACCPKWAHCKYLCKIHKLQVPTFLQCLVLSLKTGSAPAASRRYVTRKLQLSSIKTHQQITSTYYTIKAWIHCNSGSRPISTLTYHGTSS